MATALRRFEALPPAIPLAMIVVLAVAATIEYVSGLSGYFVMTDELSYVRQASEIAERWFPLTSDDSWFLSWGQLQPVLMAPAYGWLETPNAFDFVHVVNGLLMASTAIPAYLLARPLVTSRAWAHAAAALSVAVPWLALAGTVMTEPVAYPAFTWAVLGMHRAIARPSLLRDIVALALIALAFFARTQFAILGPAFLSAIVIHELSYGARADSRGSLLQRGGRAVTRAVKLHPPAVLAAVAGTAAAVALGMDRLLGGYSVVRGGQLLPEGVFDSSRDILAYIAVAVGVVPLVVSAAWAAMAFARPRSPDSHAFAVLLAGLTTVLTIMAGSFTLQYSNGTHDRYLLYIVPLLAVGFVTGLSAGRRIALPTALAGALVSLLLFSADFDEVGVTMISPSAAFQVFLDGRAYDLGRLLGDPEMSLSTFTGLAGLAAAVALAAALRWLPPRLVAVVATLAVLTYSVVETGYVLDKMEATQAGTGQEFMANRNWADTLLPPDTSAAAVLGRHDDYRTTVVAFWDLLFWNAQVDRALIAEGDVSYDQPYHDRFSFDPDTGDLDGLDHRAYLVRADGDVRFGLRGSQTLGARNLMLLETAPRPYEAAWAVLDADSRGRVSAGHTARIRVYGDGREGMRPATVVLLPTVDAQRAYRFELSGESVGERGMVNLGQRLEVPVTVRVPANGYAELELSVTGPDSGTEAGGPGLRVGGVVLPAPQ